jgi:DNA-binding MarR family transcriptional regulator
MPSKKFEPVADELSLAFGLVVRRLRSISPDENELSWTQKSLIVRLDKEGAMTISDLARAEGVKSQSMGTAVSALEGMNIVERKPHPSDGRQTLVELTAHGSELRKRGKSARRTWLAEMISKLEKGDQEILSKALPIIKRLAE